MGFQVDQDVRVPMRDGVTLATDVWIPVTSNASLPGHRVRLEVSSRAFPRCRRDTDTGGATNTETLDQSVLAANPVVHGPDHPSRLVLPGDPPVTTTSRR